MVFNPNQAITIVRQSTHQPHLQDPHDPLSNSLLRSGYTTIKKLTIPVSTHTPLPELRIHLQSCISQADTPWLLFADDQVYIPDGVLSALHDLVVSKHGLLPAGLLIPQSYLEDASTTTLKCPQFVGLPHPPLSGLLISTTGLNDVIAFIDRSRNKGTSIADEFGAHWEHLAEAGICIIPIDQSLLGRVPLTSEANTASQQKTASSPSEIKNQFESNLRVTEMVTSYGLAPASPGIEVDHYEPLRQEFIERLIAGRSPPHSGAAILDIGCGLGALVKSLVQNGYDATGIDLSETLVRIGRENLEEAGIDGGRLLVADLFHWEPKSRYTCIIASGVIWYYTLEQRIAFLRRMGEMLTDDGFVICVHRNDLFNLFALNQGTADFISEQYLKEVSILAPQFSEPDLTNVVPGLKAPIQKHTSSALTKYYENPITIHHTYDAAGLTCLQIGYTYIHPAPPRCGIKTTPELARVCQLRFESSWQGMLSGSQFIVVSSK